MHRRWEAEGHIPLQLVLHAGKLAGSPNPHGAPVHVPSSWAACRPCHMPALPAAQPLCQPPPCRRECESGRPSARQLALACQAVLLQLDDQSADGQHPRLVCGLPKPAGAPSKNQNFAVC